MPGELLPIGASTTIAVVLNLGEPGALGHSPSNRVRLVEAKHDGSCERHRARARLPGMHGVPTTLERAVDDLRAVESRDHLVECTV
jgi:hypothetical protein